MRNRISGKGKRGFSSVVGSVFMVLIMSVLASSYFVYTLSQNSAYNTAVEQRNQLAESVKAEKLYTNRTKYTAYPNTNITVNADVQNIGSTSVQFVTIWICASNTTWTGYNFTSLPVTLQSGSVYLLNINLTIQGLISTNSYNYASWLVTSRGNTYALQTLTLTNNIVVSQTTQGIGALMMDFKNFTCYNVTGNNPYYLGSYPNGASGYSISNAAQQSSKVAFRIILTDLDVNQNDIILYSSSVFFSVFPWSVQQVRGSYWYIVNVDATGKIAQTYTPVTLQYNVPTAVYFASGSEIKDSQQYSPVGSTFTGTAPVNLALIGTITGNAFGQNIPFVSIYINS